MKNLFYTLSVTLSLVISTQLQAPIESYGHYQTFGAAPESKTETAKPVTKPAPIKPTTKPAVLGQTDKRCKNLQACTSAECVNICASRKLSTLTFPHIKQNLGNCLRPCLTAGHTNAVLDMLKQAITKEGLTVYAK